MKELRWLAIILSAMFAGAKLAGVIAWTWLLVFSPVLVYIAIPVLFWLLAFIFIFAGTVWNSCNEFWDSFKHGFKGEMNDESSKR